MVEQPCNPESVRTPLTLSITFAAGGIGTAALAAALNFAFVSKWAAAPVMWASAGLFAAASASAFIARQNAENYCLCLYRTQSGAVWDCAKAECDGLKNWCTVITGVAGGLATRAAAAAAHIVVPVSGGVAALEIAAAGAAYIASFGPGWSRLDAVEWCVENSGGTRPIFTFGARSRASLAGAARGLSNIAHVLNSVPNRPG
jgi:hypothetical protein